MLRKGIIIGDRYEIVEQIGTGGMSDVYKAKCHKLNRFVAIKVLKKEFRDDKNFVSKFRVEAQSAAGLSHPNIVSVYDVGSEDGYEYIVMELIEGITLKTYIERKGHLAIKEATSIAIQVAQGMEAAHKNHIIHRDIKPQNIVISKEGKVKVTDFGIARAASANTINSNAMGSVHYISPEQARGGFVDERSDIYSLGVVMFEMVTGKVPFEGDSTVSIALRHIQDEMPGIQEIIPDAPISISKIIEKCTQKKPDARYLKVSSLIADLKKSLVMPNEDFVQIVPVDNVAATVMITDDEVSVIRNESENGIKGKIKGFTEEIDMLDFSDEELDDEIRDDNPKMDKMVKIGAIVAGVIILIIIALLSLKLFGGFSGCSTGSNGTTTENEYIDMIDVVDMDESDAQDALVELGLKVSFEYEANNDVDAGIVISQSEDEGDKVKIGSRVILVVSSGSELIEIPELTGKTKEEAITILTDLGLKYLTEEEFSNDFEIGQIIRTTPSAGDEATYGEKITLFISRGADDMALVPDVTGNEESQAEAKLIQKGFVCVVGTPVEVVGTPGLVVSYSPTGSVTKGSTITIVLGKLRTRTLEISASDLSESIPAIADDDEVEFDISFLKGSAVITGENISNIYAGTYDSEFSFSESYEVPANATEFEVKVSINGSLKTTFSYPINN